MKCKNKIIFDECYGNVSQERIKLLNQTIGVILPQSFIDLVKECDAGIPRACDFDYFNIAFQETWGSGIGHFLSLNHSQETDLLKNYLQPPEFFSEGLVAIAINGSGDFICLDYRESKNNLNPPIVYWNHDADVGKDVSFIANNFDEFLDILKEPSEE